MAAYSVVVVVKMHAHPEAPSETQWVPATTHSPKQAGVVALPHGGSVLLVVGLGRMVPEVLVV